MLVRAEQVLNLAETLRAHALSCGADVNSANLFVHNVLARTLASRASLDDVMRGVRELDRRERKLAA